MPQTFKTLATIAGGGACSVGGSCRAFSEGLMALSTKLSRRSDTLSENELQQLSYACRKFSQFRDWFVSEFGAIMCRDIQFKVFGRVYDIADDEELQKMRDYQQELGKTCSEIAVKSVIKVADILSQEES